MNTRKRQRAPILRYDKLRRQGIALGAQAPAHAAVQRIVEARHRSRGLDKMETGYALAALGWVAAPWPAS